MGFAVVLFIVVALGLTSVVGTAGGRLYLGG